MQRNKLTRPLGFGEKAFHEQELKKKSSCKNDTVESGLEKSNQQLTITEVIFHLE